MAQSNDVKRVIKYLGGYRNTKDRLYVYGENITQVQLKKWAKDGKIPAEHSRVAMILESISGCMYSCENLCPDVFAGFQFL
jgi:hypothetical protein